NQSPLRPALSVVDDFENGDYRIDESAGRSGDWFVANDGSPGATMAPSSFIDVASAIEAGDPTFGTNGFALHASGSGFCSHAEPNSNWGALIGCNLNQIVTTKNPYDASAYCALSFAARGAFAMGSSPRPLHVRVSDQWTIPDAGNCGQTWLCNAHAGVAFVVPEVDAWTTFELPLEDFRHPTVPQHAELDRSALYSIEFTFEGQGEFDVWLDDLALVACGP
ncbi:MAG TPA: hypothetical protein VM686_14270, partial [Polyangiaceae bacterium]|nr:hypothetical protein [Polyangiaceae bacterium]